MKERKGLLSGLRWMEYLEQTIGSLSLQSISFCTYMQAIAQFPTKDWSYPTDAGNYSGVGDMGASYFSEFQKNEPNRQHKNTFINCNQ